MRSLAGGTATRTVCEVLALGEELQVTLADLIRGHGRSDLREPLGEAIVPWPMISSPAYRHAICPGAVRSARLDQLEPRSLVRAGAGSLAGRQAAVRRGSGP